MVDDDRALLQALRWALEDHGMQVETAADGRQAVERGSDRRPDLLVLDMTLPVFDGYQVASALRETWGNGLPILMMTADGRAAEKASQIGALAYLRKPFDVVDLLAAVRRGLE